MTPFALPDPVKPLYHAAASAASNYVVAALDLAGSLFESAAVPFEALAPSDPERGRQRLRPGSSPGPDRADRPGRLGDGQGSVRRCGDRPAPTGPGSFG